MSKPGLGEDDDEDADRAEGLDQLLWARPATRLRCGSGEESHREARRCANAARVSISMPLYNGSCAAGTQGDLRRVGDRRARTDRRGRCAGPPPGRHDPRQRRPRLRGPGGGGRRRSAVAGRHGCRVVDPGVRLLLHPPVPVAQHRRGRRHRDHDPAPRRRPHRGRDRGARPAGRAATGVGVSEIAAPPDRRAGRPRRGRRQAAARRRGELTALLALRDCEFEPVPYDTAPAPPRAQRRGDTTSGARATARGAFALPAEERPVPRAQHAARRSAGSSSDPSRPGLSLEERIVAIALADQLGAAHRRHAS